MLCPRARFANRPPCHPEGGKIVSRRQAREYILQILFQIDVGRNDPEEALAYFMEEHKPEENDRVFIEDIIRGVVRERDTLDAHIRSLAVDWKLDRMANVDRNVLRMALYEILYREDVPTNVSINEAVELVKRFSTPESGKFVNGILGTFVRQQGIGTKQ